MNAFINVTEFNMDFNLDIKGKFLIYYILSRLYFISSIWVLFIVSQGYNLIDVAIFNIIFGITYLLCEFPSGIIADRFGRKLVVIISYLLGIVTMSIPLISTGWLAMIVWNILWAASLALSVDAEEAWLFNEIMYNENRSNDSTTTHYRQTYGILLTTALIVSGIAEITGGILVNYSLVAPFVMSILFMVLSTLWIITIPEHQIKSYNPPQTQIKYSNTRTAFNSIMKKSILLFTLIYIIFSAIASSAILWVQIYLNNKNIEISFVGVIFGIATLFYCSGVMLSAKYIRKTGNFSIISFLLFIGIGIILMGMSSVIITLGIIFLIQIIRGISAPYFKIKIIEEIPTESRATTLSIIGTISSIIGLIIELASSIYLTHNNFENYFIISGVFIIFCIPLAIVWQIFIHETGNNVLQQENKLNNNKMISFTNIVEPNRNIARYLYQTNYRSPALSTLKILNKFFNIAKKRLKRLRLCFGVIQLYQADIKVWTTIHRETNA